MTSKTPLPLSFKQKGEQFVLKQVARNDHAAVYEQSKGGKVVSYELVIPDCYFLKKGWVETYPTSEEWGIRGWTVTSLQDALNRLSLITKPLES